jgi:hypothetical protein
LDKIQRLNEPKEQRSLEDCSWYIFPPFDAVVLEKVKQALREKKKAPEATALTTCGFDSAPLPNQNIATNQGRGQSTVTAAIGSAPLRPNRLVSILQPHVPQILSGSTMQEVAPTDVSQWLAQRLALMHEAELHQATAVPPSLPPLLPEHGNALARLLFSANGPALLHEAVAAAPIPAVPPLAITTATGLNQAAILEHLAAVLTAVDARSQVALSHPQPQVLPFPVNNTTASTIPMALPLLEALLPHASATAVVPQRHNLDGINHRALLPSQVPQASLPWPLQVAAASIAPQDISTGLLALDNLAQSLRQTSVASGALLDLHANSTRFPTNSLMPTASSMASNPTMQQLSMMLNNNQPRVPNTTEDSGYTVDGGGLLPSFASATVVNAPRLSERHRHSENQGDDTETFLSTTKRRRP